ncbi:MAG: tetratricopeptide repeat protein [Ignavibacteria bacterium]|nr:tetratricopeptide repeat protein [Ignavibacteria bacterium]
MEKTKAPTQRNFFNKYESIIYLFIIILWGSLIYSNSLYGEFVFDDESVVQNNQSIRTLSNIPKFFTGEEGFHKVIGRYYRPIVSTSYAIDYWIWGLKPAGFKTTNILIHILNCTLLYFLLINIFKDVEKKRFFSFIATLFFTVHTIHTEAVTWISGRTDSLVTVFFFASLLLYVKYTYNFRNIYLFSSLVLYFLGLITKEMIITLPVVIFLYDAILIRKGKNFLKQNIKVYLYFVLVTFIFLIIRYVIFLNVPEREKYLYFYGMDWSIVLGTMVKTIPVYLKLLFIPINLLYHYNGVIADAKSLFELPVIISITIIVGFVVFSIFVFKKHNVITFCILFFFVSLLPVMNIVPTMNLMAERFLYMPSFVLSLLVMYLLIKTYHWKYFKGIVVIIFITILLLSYLTYKRNFDWWNNNSLYATGEGIDGTVLLVNSGNIYANKQNFEEAEKRYKKALEIRDNNVLAHHNLGLIYLIRRDLDSAEYRFKKGISIDSLAPDGYFQLSNLYIYQGRKAEAIKMLEKLQSIYPDYMGSKQLLEDLKSGKEPPVILPGMSNEIVNKLDEQAYKLFQEGKYEESIKILQELIEINPAGRTGSYCNIGLNYFKMRKYDKALENYFKALEYDKKNITALSGLGDTYLAKGDIKNAKKYFTMILDLEPTNEYAINKIDSLNHLK